VPPTSAASACPNSCSGSKRILAQNPAGDRWLVGNRMSYADLSLFQLVEGLRYAFPLAAERVLSRAPRVVSMHGRVASQPRVAAYLRSERRIAFNEEGIFRRYPELDLSMEGSTSLRSRTA
jgi:glutathione S-transferase